MVMTPGSGSPRGLQPPPPLPNDPSISSTLSNYLSQLSLWCRHGFAAKMNANQPLQGIMLQAYDTPTGGTPAVYMLQINSAGIFRTVPIPPGGANPGP